MIISKSMILPNSLSALISYNMDICDYRTLSVFLFSSVVAFQLSFGELPISSSSSSHDLRGVDPVITCSSQSISQACPKEDTHYPINHGLFCNVLMFHANLMRNLTRNFVEIIGWNKCYFFCRSSYTTRM